MEWPYVTGANAGDYDDSPIASKYPAAAVQGHRANLEPRRPRRPVGLGGRPLPPALPHAALHEEAFVPGP